MPMKFERTKLNNSLFYAGCTIIMLVQVWLCLFQIASYWQWGHNGYNGAAYQVAARNTIRHNIIWPVQYHTEPDIPEPSEYYTHAPLGLHFFTTLSVAAFGDREVSVRIVPSVFSVLMMLMLLILLAKHYSKPMALVAGTIFLFLPINTIYCNMTNHSTGCIFFTLLMFNGYLDWVKKKKNIYLIEVAAGFLGTTFFDWPGYTLSFCLATAAFYEGMKPDPQKGFEWTRQLRFSLVLYIMIGLSFKIFLSWVSTVRGIDDIFMAITNRSGTTNLIQVLRDLYGTVVDTMFPKLLRYMAFIWMLVIVIRHAGKIFRREDIVPVSFFVTGMVQFVFFPNAAALHHYWNWQFNPFIAIACGQLILWIAREGGNRLALSTGLRKAGITVKIAAWVIPLALIGFLFIPVAVEKFKEGRAMAGSFNIPDYKREYKKILFAKFVNEQTDPEDGVAIHNGLTHRIEFESYLDRDWIEVSADHLKDLNKHLDKKKKWVLIGDMDRIKKQLLVKLVKEHPIAQVNNYFLIDLRKKGSKARVYWLKPLRPLWGWKFFVNAYDPPYRMTRVAVLEQRLLDTMKNLPPEKVKSAGKVKKDIKSKALMPKLHGSPFVK